MPIDTAQDVVILYTTWPDAETAETVAAEAVAERLAACVNLLGPMRAIYRWQGAVDRANETPALFKTTIEHAEALRDLIVSRHPYETPAVLALSVGAEGSNPAFLAWVAAETGVQAGGDPA
jgi:periplasmic divalent cation tolerance protein